MKKYRWLSQLGLVVILVLFLVGTVLYSWVTFTDPTADIRAKIGAAVPTLLTLIYSLLTGIPALSDLLRLSHSPTDEDIENALAELGQAKAYLDHGQYRDALQKANGIIEKLPQKADAYEIRGRAHEGLSAFASAVEDFTKAIEMEPNHYVYWRRGRLYEKMGDNNSAIADLKESIYLAPQSLLAQSLNHLARLYYSMGQLRLAAEYYEKARLVPQASPDDLEEAFNKLQEIQDYYARKSELEAVEQNIRDIDS